MRRRAGATALAAIILPVAGCSHKNKDMLDFLQAHEHEVSAIEYRVGVPDGIEISAPRILEIDGEMHRVQPDGKINLRLLGEVKVSGMTAKEIASKLEVLLSKYYQDPKVNVRVSGYNSKKYYVFGEVGGVGPRVYTGRDTLLEVIARSGTSFLSWTSQVKIIRPSPDRKERREIIVDVDRMIRTGDTSANILIEPDDIIYVPPTPLAWVGLRIRELLFPVSPVLDAYVTPATVMDASDEYDDDENDTPGNTRRFGPRRY
ncbi:MAG: hypothetical protein AMXMBFR22_12600 [Phycisphaerae bacterium]